MKRAMRILFALALAALGSACHESGFIRVQLTDAPLEAVAAKQVLVTIGEVRVHDDADKSTPTNGNPAAGADKDGADGQGWIVLCNKTQTFDLMQLRNGAKADFCAGQATELVAGKISQMRLGVIAATLILQDGSTHELTVPSGPQSGLKINIDQTVSAKQTLMLVIDFDADKSIVAEGNGSYKLKPVLRLAQ